ncbi:vacuolar protein sorting-associated protein 11-like protein [Chrysochromulina tobinii]|uniref:Vacuolar protein sorting-associated protein 11-like protein n=1 Tax=Chrysochromulina tobinii TaxID=1460289 RepID=A0A0M0JWN4_9EUKA|nr:vacuolar protein sorting-associated protein 11-like protein [Chrysochromulina tobinii]|eukprot:KOO31071.1 vacuolar protein sorting-associated protein 11-like protein [Chrysochromulina sp. CCMP291]
MASWRRLSFFDESSQTDPSGLLERASAVCALADGGIIVGEADGTCHSLNGALAVRVTFAAHSGGVTHLLQPRSSALVVSLGLEHEAGVPRAYLRAWRIGADEATCVRHLRVFPVVAKATTGAAAASTSSEPAITCCCAAADLSQIALGLADGSVQLLRCDKFLSDKFLSFKPLASIAAALPGAPAAVTNVAFCYAQGANHPPTDLWVVTSDALLSVSAAGLRSETSLVLAEGGGAAPECACVSDMRGQLVLGRPEAIYLYGADERGATYGFDMPKRCVLAFGGYLVVISSRELFGRSAAAESGGGGALGPLDTALGAGSAPDVGGPDVAATAKQHVVQLYDLANKYMGTSIELGARVKWAIPCSDRLLLLTHEGRLVSLVERPWKTKLQLLYRKHLYSTALALATARGMRRAVLSEIHREYADHLYAKGDLSSALDQYIETIGTLPPSTVIARYLTSQRVRDLTRYLQALVAEGSAAVSAPEHSALLLRCLAKLMDLPALEHFVQWAKREPAKAARHAPAAIETLRACGYASLAAELAEASGAPSVLLRLLVEETQEFDKVLALIRQMPLAEGRAALLRWVPLASALAPLGIEARRQRASALIKRPGVLLDDDHALLLTFQYGWLDGRAQLYESLGRPHELLRHYILVAEDEKVLRTCRRHGESEPQMWLAALRHLLASELLERHLRAADAALEEQSREASRFGDDVAKMRAEIAEIDGCVRVFQQPKCSACLGPLDVPTIHFHCQHSYHLACLGDHDHECPLCAPQHRRVAEHQQQQRALARGQEDFYRALDNSADGVATVAEFLGRGFLSTINAK